MKFTSLPGGEMLPVIGLGTWNFGGGMQADRSQDRRALDALSYALELGYRHFDTAEMYAAGHSEELLGQAIRGYPRQELFITSKVSAEHLRPADVRRACENSLKRLNTGYLDLYLVHWPNRRLPLNDTFQALNDLQAAGKVRYLGVSNFDLPLLQEAQALAHTPLATNQVPYSLYDRQYARNGVLPYCQAHGILLTAYTPVDQGQVSGDPLVRQAAGRCGITPVQAALAWLVRQPGIIAIPASQDREHLRENLAAAEVELGAEDAELLEGLTTDS